MPGDRTAGPELAYECGELRAIICQARRSLRRIADDRRARLREFCNTLEHRDGHELTRAAQIQHAIAGAPAGREPPILDVQLLQERFAIHEIPLIVHRCIGERRERVQGGDGHFLAVEVRHVRHIAALLQHEARARDVIDPTTVPFTLLTLPLTDRWLLRPRVLH